MGRPRPDGGPSPGARVAVACGPQGQAQAVITLVPAAGRWSDWRDSAHDALIRLSALFLAERAQPE